MTMEPTIEIPVLPLKQLQDPTSKLSASVEESLRAGMDMGCFWVDLGDPSEKGDSEQLLRLATPDLWRKFHATMDTARTAKHWSPHRFAEPKNKYLEALMHSSVCSGLHRFERKNFETVSTFGREAERGASECYSDVDPTLLEVEQHMASVGEATFTQMARLLGLPDDYLIGKPEDRWTRSMTMHRVTPDPSEHMAAEPHFDFTLCNILLYNYVDGFKVYYGETWYRLAEPKHPNMLLFNLGSMLSIRSNRHITALFHKVDTPAHKTEQRLSLVSVMTPQLHVKIQTHPSLITAENPQVFQRHSALHHLFYAGKHYTTLSKHVNFDKSYEKEAINFTIGDTIMTAIAMKVRHWFVLLHGSLGRLTPHTLENFVTTVGSKVQQWFESLAGSLRPLGPVLVLLDAPPSRNKI